MVQVTRRPIGGAVISEVGIIERVQHQIGPQRWTVTYQLSPYYPEAAVMTVDGTENTPGQACSGGDATSAAHEPERNVAPSVISSP